MYAFLTFILVFSSLSWAQTEPNLEEECSDEKKMKALIRREIMTKDLCLNLTDDKLKLVITGATYDLGEHYQKSKYNYVCPPTLTSGNGGTATPTATATAASVINADFKNFPKFFKQLATVASSSAITGDVTGYADGVVYVGTGFDDAISKGTLTGKVLSSTDKPIFDTNRCIDKSKHTSAIRKVLSDYRNYYLANARAEFLKNQLITKINAQQVKNLTLTAKSVTSPELCTGAGDFIGCCRYRRGAVADFNLPKLSDQVKVKKVYMAPVFNAPETEALSKTMIKTAVSTFVKDLKDTINASTDSDLKTLIASATVSFKALTAEAKKEALITDQSAYYIKISGSLLTSDIVFSKTLAQVNSYISTKWGVTPAKSYEKAMTNYMVAYFWACFKDNKCTYYPEENDIYIINSRPETKTTIDLKAKSYIEIKKSVLLANRGAYFVVNGIPIDLSATDYKGTHPIKHFYTKVPIPKTIQYANYTSGTAPVLVQIEKTSLKTEYENYKATILAYVKIKNDTAFSKLVDPLATDVANFFASAAIRNYEATESPPAFTLDTTLKVYSGNIISNNNYYTTTNLQKAANLMDSEIPSAYGNNLIVSLITDFKSSSPSQGTEIFSYMDFKDAYAEMYVTTNKDKNLYKYTAQAVPTKYIAGVKVNTGEISDQTGNVDGKGYFHTACGSGLRWDKTLKKFKYYHWWNALSETEVPNFYKLPTKVSPFNMKKLKHLYAYLIKSCKDCSCIWGKTSSEIVTKLASSDTTHMDFSGTTTTYSAKGNDFELILGDKLTYDTEMCLFSPIVPLAHYAGEGEQSFTPKTIVPPKVECQMIELAKKAVPTESVTADADVQKIYDYCIGTTGGFATKFPMTESDCKTKEKSGSVKTECK